MATQSYSNHRQVVPLFHGVLFLALVLTLVGSIVNLYESLGDHQRLYSAALILVLTASMIMLFLRANLRTEGSGPRHPGGRESAPLRDDRETAAPGTHGEANCGSAVRADAEFVTLAQRAAKDSLAPNDIKKAVQNWRADTYRV